MERYEVAVIGAKARAERKGIKLEVFYNQSQDNPILILVHNDNETTWWGEAYSKAEAVEILDSMKF